MVISERLYYDMDRFSQLQMQINTASQLLAVLPLCCARVWICGGLSQAIYNPSMYFPATLAVDTCKEGSIQPRYISIS